MKYTKHSKAQQNTAKKDATWEKFKNQQNKLNANRRGVRSRGNR